MSTPLRPLPSAKDALLLTIGPAALQALMLGGFRTDEPLGPYAQQLAVAQNERIKQCAADLRSDMAAMTGRMDTMHSLLMSASRKIVELEHRDAVGFGRSRSMQASGETSVRRGAGALESVDVEERARRLVEEMGRDLQGRVDELARVVQVRIDEAVAIGREREDDMEKRLLEAIQASEEKSERRCDKELEELESKVRMVDKWVEWLKKKADNSEGQAEVTMHTLDGMEKKIEGLSRKHEEGIEEVTVKIKVTDDRINDIDKKITDEGMEHPEKVNDTPDYSLEDWENLGLCFPLQPAQLIEVDMIMRQVDQQTNSRIDGLENRINALTSKIVAMERLITRVGC